MRISDWSSDVCSSDLVEIRSVEVAVFRISTSWKYEAEIKTSSPFTNPESKWHSSMLAIHKANISKADGHCVVARTDIMLATYLTTWCERPAPENASLYFFIMSGSPSAGIPSATSFHKDRKTAMQGKG